MQWSKLCNIETINCKCSFFLFFLFFSLWGVKKIIKVKMVSKFYLLNHGFGNVTSFPICCSTHFSGDASG